VRSVGRIGLALTWALVAAASSAAAADAPGDADAARRRAEETTIDVLVVGRPDSYDPGAATSSTRTPTPLQQTPQSVSVVTRPLIDDQQVRTVSDALLNVSGVVPTNTALTPAFDNTLIRGFPAERLVDGFTQYYNPGDRESTVNVERIEVLKGTNGMLYGGGAGSPAGGVVNEISKTPRSVAARTVGVRVGSWALVQPFFDLNQPFGDHVRLRVTGEYTTEESQIDVLHNQRFNVNPALTLTDGDATTLTLRGRISRWRQPDYQGLPATGTVVQSKATIPPGIRAFLGNVEPVGKVEVDRSLFIGDPDIEDSRSQFDSGAVHFEHRFSDAWHTSVQARYARSEFEEEAQLIGGAGLDFGADRPVIEPPELARAFHLGTLPFSFFDARLFQEQKEVSALANAVGEGSWGPIRATLLLGGDYSRYDDAGFINFLTVPRRFIIDVADPVFDQPYTRPGPGKNDNFVVNTVMGGYAQVQATLYERLHLVAGARLGRVRIDFESPDRRDVTDTWRWIPRAGAVLDLGAGVSLFGGYSSGMRGQPFAIFTETPLPERSSQLEGGLKLAFGEWLRGQVAYYSIDRTNVAVPDPDGGIGSVPRGHQASHGVDAELLLRPIESVSLIAAYSWTRASFEDDLFASYGSGLDAIPGVPENSGRVWLHYDFPSPLKGLGLGVGAHAQSQVQISRRNAFFTDGFVTFDAAVSYDAGFLTVGLRVANLTDEAYFVRLNYLGGRVAPGPGRSWQVTTALHF